MLRTMPFATRRPLPGPAAADTLVLALPAVALQRLCDPLSGSAWGIEPFSVREVVRTVPVSQPYEPKRGRWTRSRHLGRVHWLLAHGWDAPIEVDVGVPELGCTVAWPLLDGNHRFAAALLAGDREIAAVAGGSLRYMRELFGEQVFERLPVASARVSASASPRPPVRGRGRQPLGLAVSR